MKENCRKKNLTTCERKISSYKPALRTTFLLNTPRRLLPLILFINKGPRWKKQIRDNIKLFKLVWSNIKLSKLFWSTNLFIKKRLFIKKEPLAQVLSHKFCEISNTFFIEHLRETASEIRIKFTSNYSMHLFAFQKLNTAVLISTKNITSRSSHSEVFCNEGVLKNLAKRTWKHLCQSLFFYKKRRCFTINSVKFLRTSFSWNTSGGCSEY